MPTAERRGGGIEESGIRDQVLLLDAAVLQLLQQDLVVGEAIVENSITCAQHHFWRSVLPFRAEAPGYAQPGREVGVIAEIILRFVTEARADGDIRTQAPVVLHEQCEPSR